MLFPKAANKQIINFLYIFILMKKALLLAVFLVSSVQLFSQEVVFAKDIHLTSFIDNKREAFPVVNSEKNEIALFLLDNKVINSLLIDKNFGLVNSFAIDRPVGMTQEILGHSADSYGYHLFFTNGRKNKFYTRSIDVLGNRYQGRHQDIKLKGEKFLESVSYKNKFYLLTVKKKSSVLKLYVFEGNNLQRTETFDFSAHAFSDTYFPELYYALQEGISLGKTTFNIQKIEINNPNPLDLTSKPVKIYYYDNKLFLTLDNSYVATKIITIDLQDFTSSLKLYEQGNPVCDRIILKSNSYLYNNMLYQITGCKDELYYSVLDIRTGALLKDFTIYKEEEIPFKNTPLIQEGGATIFVQGETRELNRTKQVLRKITASDVGISVYPAQDQLELTIGGYKEIKTGSGGSVPMMMPGGISTPYGTASVPTYHYNPTMYGFDKYSNSRTVYFKSLLDKNNFEHVPGEISYKAYDRIKDYQEKIRNEINTETIFRVGEMYIFGYYKRGDKKYYLRSFRDGI